MLFQRTIEVTLPRAARALTLFRESPPRRKMMPRSTSGTSPASDWRAVI